MTIMLKNIKHLRPSAHLSSELFRSYVEGFETEILRGLGTLCILNIIRKHGSKGTYGYQLLKELKDETENMLIIEEGTLYPMLRKLEEWGPSDNPLHLIKSDKKKIKGRVRKYYTITEVGDTLYNHMEGFFNNLIGSVSGLFSMSITLDKDRYLYCPNCSNKIDLAEKNLNFCVVCGMSIGDLKHRLEKEENEHGE